MIHFKHFNISNYISGTFLILLAGLSGCAHSHEEDSDHSHAEEQVEDHGHAGEENKVHLLQNQMDAMDIQLGHLKELNLSTTVKSNGRLELPPQNKASLSAISGGRITSIKVLEGDYVRRGQVLAILENPDFITMQEEYLLTGNELAYLEKDYLRQKALFADSIASEKVYQQAELQYRAADAKRKALRARFALYSIDPAAVDKGEFVSSISIKSPINGFVRLVEVNMGMYVTPEQEMFEIVDNDHIHIDLMVYEKDMSKVKVGQKVIFSLSTDPDSVFTGKIFSLGKAFDREKKAMVTHAEIDNKQGGLLPGMYVDARIVTNSDVVRALPEEAIVTDGGLQYIFVHRPISEAEHNHLHAAGEDHGHEYVFEKMEVNTGASDIGFTEVIPVEPLGPETRVVTAGAYYLMAEMKKGEGGHGHHH